MAIFVNGTLSVQRVSGTHGEFSVGKLECDFGVLNIKDPELDQYESGKYPGRFKIDRIFPNGYMTRTGCFIVEVRALVSEYIIHSDEPDALDTDVALTEVDPLEEHKQAQVVKPMTPAAPPQAPTAGRPSRAAATTAGSSRQSPSSLTKAPRIPSEPQARAVDDPMMSLFGELWPLGDEVKLDPTTIRSDAENHRKRTQYLRQHGYVFKAQLQSWVRNHAPVIEETLL